MTTDSSKRDVALVVDVVEPRGDLVLDQVVERGGLEVVTAVLVVDAVGVAQSTVSLHLKARAEVRFVLAEPRGTATLTSIVVD